MSEPFKDECPLCGNTASFELINHRNGYDILCNHCGRFDISVKAMKEILFSWNEQQKEHVRQQISVGAANKTTIEIIYNAATNTVDITHV